MSWTRFVVEEDLEQVKTYHTMRRLKPGSAPNSYELRFINREGQVRDLFMSVAVIPETKESVASIIDITERKQAEEALKKSEERYRAIFENTGTASILFGESTTILLANTNFEKLSGYSRQELEGKMSWTDYFVDNEDLEKMRQYHEMREMNQDSAPASYEFHFINRNGEKRDILMEIAIIHENDVRIAALIDITERKLMEKSLQQSEAKYRFLTEKMNDLIWTANLDFNLTYISPSVKEILGFTPEESIRQNPIEMMTPESYATVMDVLSKELKSEKKGEVDPARSVKMELDFYHKDGSIVRVESVMSEIRDQDGNLVGIHGVSRDITDRHRAEAEKKKLETQLFQAQKMESIGTLAGGIAHDFNNLLTGILGNVSLALMKMDDSNPLREQLKIVEEYVQRGSDLTKQLLGFARGGKYEVKPTNLGEFTRKSSEMFGRTRKEIRIHHKAQEGLWTVEVDRGQMEQVLLNLYVNAWQAMTGGGDLYLSAENVVLGMTEVNPNDIRPGKFVKVTVTDTGIGMDEETKARIFEPFFTTKERGRGTGLGLASVYGIIKNHGGFINVESKKGFGTSFMIYLPVSNKEIEPLYKQMEEVQKGRGTVLLIDDEKMILDVGSKMLEGLGYQVITAMGGRQGLEIYKRDQDKIDLVLLDMIMPDYSGKETFDTLLMINQSVRVLLSSGYSLNGQANEIMQSGCKGFIQKPFTMEELSKRIRGILDERQEI